MMVDKALTASDRFDAHRRYSDPQQPVSQRSVPKRPVRSTKASTPSSELEAQIYFYMQPTAKELNQRRSYLY